MTVNPKGSSCPYKPILCETRLSCNDCQIYTDWIGHQRYMGRESVVVGRKATPDWLVEFEKEQGGKLAILRGTIRIKRDEAFAESAFGSREKKMQMQAMVNAYDVVLKLIRGII